MCSIYKCTLYQVRYLGTVIGKMLDEIHAKIHVNMMRFPDSRQRVASVHMAASCKSVLSEVQLESSRHGEKGKSVFSCYAVPI